MLYPGDAEGANACALTRTEAANAETFGLLVGAAVGILIGRFAFSGRR